MKLLVSVLFALFVENTFAQTMGSDREGKSISEFQKSETFSLPVSSADNSAKINYTFKLPNSTQYYGRHSTIPSYNRLLAANNESVTYDNTLDANGKPIGYTANDSSRFTIAKSWGINASFKISNLLSNLAKIATFHPKYSLSLGIGRNIDEFNNWENIRLLRNPFYNWNLTFGLEMDAVKLYDTILKTPSTYKHPISKSATLNGTCYFPRISQSMLLGISAVLTYTIGNNISDLKKYQDNKALYIDNNITTLGDYIGRIGDFKNQNSFRSAFSINIFPKSLNFKNDTVQLCIMPYTSLYGAVNTHFTKLVGVYVNASQGKSLFANGSTIKPGIGFGVDWVVAPGGIGDVNIFVGGSLDIHSFFPHKKPAAQ